MRAAAWPSYASASFLTRPVALLQRCCCRSRCSSAAPSAPASNTSVWIHNEDLTGFFLAALDNAQAIGPINGTAPKPVTNAELSKSLGRALHRPSFMPTPSFAAASGVRRSGRSGHERPTCRAGQGT